MTRPDERRRYEVVREHHSTGRVQLVAWDLDEDASGRAVAEFTGPVNGSAHPTMATSGKLEHGWTYRAREVPGRRPKRG